MQSFIEGSFLSTYLRIPDLPLILNFFPLWSIVN